MQVIIIDEIGTADECGAARTIAQRGVQLVATAHGNELENVIKNPSLADLVGQGCIITFGPCCCVHEVVACRACSILGGTLPFNKWALVWWGGTLRTVHASACLFCAG